MKKLLMAAVLALVASPLPARAQTPPRDALAPAENAFALDMYSKLRQTPGNLFFSPYSVATALDMVYAGARGSTADEIAHTLHLNLLDGTAGGADLQAAVLNAANKQRSFLTDRQEGWFTLQSANALWGDKGYTFNPDFIANIEISFGGDLAPVDFKDPERASATINEWAAQQTHDKIPNLVSPGMLLDDPPLVLTNAVYFKAAWQARFDTAATKKTRFHVSAGHDAMADMMTMSGRFSLTQADGVEIVSIPYSDYRTSMMIILPDDRRSLADVEAKLSAATLKDWLAKSQDIPVILSIPKFETDSAFDLKNALSSLGMDAALNSKKADFTGIADDPTRPIYIGGVVHKAHIEVDEQGTEAAAATAVVMVATAARLEKQQPPVRFFADHPFVYLIGSSDSGEILFMGRINDPTKHAN